MNPLTLVTVGDTDNHSVDQLEMLHGTVTVVRRCPELAELLAACQSGLAKVAVVAGSAGELTATLVDRLTAVGVCVVAVAPTNGEAVRLRGIGAFAVTGEVTPAGIVEAALAAVNAQGFGHPTGFGVPGPRTPFSGGAAPAGGDAGNAVAASGAGGLPPASFPGPVAASDPESGNKLRPGGTGEEPGGSESTGFAATGLEAGAAAPQPSPIGAEHDGSGATGTRRMRRRKKPAGPPRSAGLGMDGEPPEPGGRATSAPKSADHAPESQVQTGRELPDNTPAAGTPPDNRRPGGAGVAARVFNSVTRRMPLPRRAGFAGSAPDFPRAAVPRVGAAATGRASSGHTATGPAGRGGRAKPQTIAVWGPIGSPGRTTLAVNLAAEFALQGSSVLVIDADTYGASIAATLGLLDESASFAQACRVADQGSLTSAELARTCTEVVFAGGTFSLLTGLTRSDRWPELRAAAVERVLETARTLADIVVIDCGFCLETDEELSYDTVAPRRNATTVSALARADTIYAVGSGDAISIPRLVRALADLAETNPGIGIEDIAVVVNKVRRKAVGGSPLRGLEQAWQRFGPAQPISHYLPWDPDVTDKSLLEGRLLLEVAPESPLRQAIRDICCAHVQQNLKTAVTNATATAANTG